MPGAFYFAHADAGETFNPVTHAVNDEEVLSFKFTHQEGDFAQIEVEIRNPRIGLLNVGRPRWAFLSFDHAVDGVVPIFYGRIIGIPTNVFSEVVSITYTARPEDYVEQKIALAETLKVVPFWDPIFVADDKIDDPDVVLESRAALWHVDPVTHEVSISSVVAGEDGTIEKQADEFFAETLSLTLNQSPATSIRIKGSISWDQKLTSQFSGGALNLGGLITQRFPAIINDNFSGEAYPMQLVSSFTFKGLQSSWPKPGATVQGGYTVREGELKDVSFLAVPQLQVQWYFASPDNPFDPPVLPAALPVGSIVFQPKITGKWWSGETAGFSTQTEIVFAPLGLGIAKLTLDYNVEREYTENITIVVKTSTQPIVTEPGEDEFIELAINGNKVSTLIGGEVPIGDVRRSKFFMTDRGKQAIRYLLACARAALVFKSRAVEISFEVPFPDGIEFGLRKSALIHNPRLPGGEASGKIIAVEHSLNGDDGAAITKITMACTIGRGETPYVPTGGTPTYGSTAYMGADYQVFEGGLQLVDASIPDLAFTVDAYTPNDDGIDGTHILVRDIVKNLEVQNHSGDQRAIIGPLAAGIGDTQQLSAILQEHFTQISLTLHNLEAGPFSTDVTITVEDLIIPKQIDLEAPSV